MPRQHSLKTIELLLSLMEVIPCYTAQPTTYQELADKVVEKGTTANYDSVRRILSDSRLQKRLNLVQTNRGRAHAIRYKKNSPNWPYSGLIAYMSSHLLLPYLPDEIRQHFEIFLAPLLEEFEKLNHNSQEKEWLSKCLLSDLPIGTYLHQNLNVIWSCLYDGQWLEITYKTKIPNKQQTTNKGCIAQSSSIKFSRRNCSSLL